MPPLFLIFILGACFLLLERIAPGRHQRHAPGWYVRAILLNLAQLGVVLIGGVTWTVWLQGASVFSIAALHPVTQGFVCWFVGRVGCREARRGCRPRRQAGLAGCPARRQGRGIGHVACHVQRRAGYRD